MLSHLKTFEDTKFVVKGTTEFVTGNVVAMKGLEPDPDKIRIYGTFRQGQFVPISRAIINHVEVDVRSAEEKDGTVVFTPKFA